MVKRLMERFSDEGQKEKSISIGLNVNESLSF
jgi:hypothetical protein